MEEYFFLSIPPKREDQETVFVIRFTSLRRISAVFLSIRSQTLIRLFTAILFQFVVQSNFPFSNIQCLNISFILLRNLRLNFIVAYPFFICQGGFFIPHILPPIECIRDINSLRRIRPALCVLRTMRLNVGEP